MNKRWTSMLASLVIAAPLWAQTTPQPPAAVKPEAKPAPQLKERSQRDRMRVRGPHAFAFAESGGSRSYLGVDVTDVTSDRVAALKLKEERGVEITMVDQDAPAGKAGLKEHDVILEYNKTRVEGEEQLRRLIRETPPGRSVHLVVSRDGVLTPIDVTLGDRSKVWANSRAFSYEMPKIVVPEVPDIEIPSFDIVMRSYSPSTGIMIDNLTRQLGQYFGVADGQGVLVRSVERGSAAEAAGFKAGDVIVKVDNEKIGDRSDWRRAIRKRSGGKLNVTVMRDKKEQVLTLTLPEPRREQGQLQGFTLPDGVWDLYGDWDDLDPQELEEHKKEMEELKKELPKLKQEMKKLRETLAKQAKLQAELARKDMLKVKDVQKLMQKDQLKAMRETEKTLRKALLDMHFQQEI